MDVETGKLAPEICLPDSDGKPICLKDFKGQWVVLYFYPKDNTSGCTLEAIAFTRQIHVFTEARTKVLGVSPDSQKSHCGFRDKYDLKVKLLSDPDKAVISEYGCWVQKKMYGRDYMGVERSTFLIDPEGVLVAAWRKVKVKGHVEAVLNALRDKV